MGVDNLNWLYCLLINAFVHPSMHFSTYVGSEFWFVLDSNAKGTHLTTEGYYFQMFFSQKTSLIVRVRRALTQLFCRPVEKKWDQ